MTPVPGRVGVAAVALPAVTPVPGAAGWRRTTPGGWQTGGVSAVEPVRVKPRRVRLVCWVSAAALLVLFGAMAVSLSGSTGNGYGTFQAR